MVTAAKKTTAKKTTAKKTAHSTRSASSAKSNAKRIAQVERQLHDQHVHRLRRFMYTQGHINREFYSRLDETDRQIGWLVDMVDWLTRPTPTYVWVCSVLAGVLFGALWIVLPLVTPTGTFIVAGLAVGCLTWAILPREWNKESDQEPQQEEA